MINEFIGIELCASVNKGRPVRLPYEKKDLYIFLANHKDRIQVKIAIFT